MTLTSSRISDEFKLVQDILAIAIFGQCVKLYDTLSITVRPSGWIDLVERNQPVVTLRTRDAARYILRRWW